PAFGTDPERGNFLNTTTYFVGRAEPPEEGLSFMQIASEEATNENALVRRGIFLETTDEPAETAFGSDDHFKFYLDAYSRLGFFTGLSYSFEELLIFRNFQSFLGLGFSRNIYNYPQIGYSPYRRTADGSTESVWHTSELFGATLPFRYGFTSESNFQLPVVRINYDFSYYSDPSFFSDFLNRQEDMTLSQYLGLDDEEEDESQTIISELERFSWSLNTSANIPVSLLNPYVSQLSIQDLDTNFAWRKSDIENGEYDSVDPRNSYFYPQKLSFPNLRLTLSGTLFSFGSSSGNTSSSPDNQDAGNREYTPVPPWEFENNSQGEDEEENEEDSDGVRRPESRNELSISDAATPLVLTLQYSTNQSYIMEHETDWNNWELPSDVSFSFIYSAINYRNTFNFNYRAQVYNNLFQLTGSLRETYQFREHLDYDADTQSSQWSSFTLSDYQNTNFKIQNNLALSSRPFQAEPALPLSFTYTLNMLLLEYSFLELVNNQPVFETETIEFTEDFYSAHSLQTQYTPEYIFGEQRAQLQFVLPPRDMSFTTSLAFNVFWMNMELSGGYTQEEDENEVTEWVPRDIQGALRLNRTGDVNLSQTAVYSLEDMEFKNALTSLSIWNFAASLRSRQEYNYELNSGNWERLEGDAFFQPWQISLGYDNTLETPPLWRNRIQCSIGIDTDWRINMVRFTENLFQFSLSFGCSIHEFLDLEFSSTSRNTATYRYFPFLVEQVDFLTPLNPFEDLLKSFNFFNTTDRQVSNFNIQSLSFSATHHLHDWDLVFTYEGEPERVVDDNGRPIFSWNTSFSILIQWIPIRELESDITINDDGISY
ncbi:MAG: hypothetical protein ACLFR1_10455, partial [Spirochaetia bacterium]